MSLCCTVGYKWITAMDGIKFEFNGIISYEKQSRIETVCKTKICYTILIILLLLKNKNKKRR